MKLSIKQYKEIVGFNSPLYNITDYTKFNWLSNQGQIKHNLWDEEWELGTYDTTTGAAVSTNQQIRSKSTDLIAVKPNTSYYMKFGSNGSAWILFYDKDNHLITGLSNSEIGAISQVNNAFEVENHNFRTPLNCYYVKFYATATYGTTYHNDIYIYQVIENLVANSGTSFDIIDFKVLPNDCYSFRTPDVGSSFWAVVKNTNSTFAYGDYKVNYRSNSNTSIIVRNTTKSIYIKQVNNRKVFDETFTLTPANYTPGDSISFIIIAPLAGTDYLISNYYVTKIDDSLKWGYVDLGSLSWILNSNCFYTTVSDLNSSKKDFSCSLYTTITDDVSVSGIYDVYGNMKIGTNSSVPGRVYITNTNYTNASDFKSGMAGKILMYEKNTTE